MQSSIVDAQPIAADQDDGLKHTEVANTAPPLRLYIFTNI